MGASCAFQLSERGLKVAVLEAQIAPAMGSTGRSTAGVRVQFTEEVNIRLSWESIQEYQHFQDLYGEDAGYRPIGYLLLVHPERLGVHLTSVRLSDSWSVANSRYLDQCGGFFRTWGTTSSERIDRLFNHQQYKEYNIV